MRFVLLAWVFGMWCAAAPAADTIEFWDTPQHGANSFNGAPPDAAYFRALRGHGATWVRLEFSKWKSRERDFLFGNLDDYHGLVAEAVEKGEPYELPRKPNPVFEPIRRRLMLSAK